ncbi:MAG: XTP/dITP diphosphatase [Clostridia bacterium]|nr:XTP/dITP diphosphatase [Clostridia bacterium]
MATKKLVIATHNKGKLKEFQELLSSLNVQVLSLGNYPEIGEIEETGDTFTENALLKARLTAEKTGLISLADDSGLEVDYLNGLPGVKSARFAGEPKSDARNNQKLLQLLEGVPPEKRTARFKCVIAIVKPDRSEYVVEGSCEGIILDQERGTGGFGYDPLFYIPELKTTFAELELALKNKISHRGQAMTKALQILERMF